MTHLMASGEADGRYFAFPTIMEDDEGNLKRYKTGAFRRAMETGNYIEFPSAREADWFSRNYKRPWKK